ncbi:MAG: FAD-binding oxidoreductase [Gemmatimonadaceae bacterium]|nr:FAD-binding oxidoreductase [Gemmatimonadaceae bacterium]NUQ92180.1 FAD-binding oxidoreductase [Gemmatimonadaceae bacterium]NUR20961.1 FAD-binding oxidoreductase [Gemmatimonadaceae bacterium]NUS97470.1 FAD-binding oxidoreductase [Gemmatimonadaceae bacterium]
MTRALARDPALREGFAQDASGLRMVPDAVARPATHEETADIVRECAASGTALTPAGGQTSTTAASIADHGVLLSLRSMDRVLDLDPRARTVRVEAGALVADVKRAAAAEGLLFAPDPTSEESCTIGGAIACNASGARTLRYGATRAHVRALTVVLASGETIELRRNPLEKNTVGYALVHDPIDWFVGSEGTLGVVTRAELALLPLPERVVGLAVPFASERDALRFVVAARESSLAPRCLEYFDTLALVVAAGAHGDRLCAPGTASLVYAEDAGRGDVPLDEWLALAESCGAVTDDLRVLEGEAALREAREARHAVPATMNERGARRRPYGGRKVSTDWAVPFRRLHEAIAVARELAGRAGIEQAVIYGHAGNGHPHQNFIAEDADAVVRIERVVEETLRSVIAMGGTVAAEHGIGKLKKKWLPLQLSELQRSAMRAMKNDLDPKGILAPGNVL